MASLRDLGAAKHPQNTTLPPPCFLVLSFSASISTFDSSVQGKLFQRSDSSCRCWIAFLFFNTEAYFFADLPDLCTLFLTFDWCTHSYWLFPELCEDPLMTPWGSLRLKHLALRYLGDFGGTIKLYYVCSWQETATQSTDGQHIYYSEKYQYQTQISVWSFNRETTLTLWSITNHWNPAIIAFTANGSFF